MVSQVADEKQQLLSKKAGCNSHGQDSSYFLGWQEYEKNPFDPATNPGGIIQMGLAENQEHGKEVLRLGGDEAEAGHLGHRRDDASVGGVDGAHAEAREAQGYG